MKEYQRERSAGQNPYAKKDGSPKNGQEFKFFDWAIDRHNHLISKLSPSDRKKVLAIQKAFADRMNS